jgi:hypothetical protein
MKDDEFVKALRGANSRDDVWKLLDESAGG